jgi:putative transposase
MRLQYPIPFLRRVLNVSSSSYYAWLKRKPSKRTQEDARLEAEIKAAHKRTKETCGPERLQKDMAEHGVQAGVYRIRRLRTKLGIRCKQVKKFKATTDSGHNLPVAENILGQNFEVTAPNKVWVSDITYIPTGEGWLYLAGHKDVCSGEVVGYAMSNRINRTLVSQSLFKGSDSSFGSG